MPVKYEKQEAVGYHYKSGEVDSYETCQQGLVSIAG